MTQETIQIIFNVYQAILCGVVTYLIVKSFQRRKKDKDAFEQLQIDNNNNWAKAMQQNHEDWGDAHVRLNILSKENAKLRDINEELKERLRNLGVNDFDVIN